MHRRLALTALVLAALTAGGCAGKSSPGTAGIVGEQTVQVTYAGGKVTGQSGLVKVRLNSQLHLVVTSDVADEVHLHGYDKSAGVAKGATVTISFQAKLPGRFEVELEKLGRRLVTLQVQ